MAAPPPNPLANILERQPVFIIDGGLATELEARGCDLDDDLWSASILLDAPDVIAEVHMDYLRAGADVIISSTYQASFAGLQKYGIQEDDACDVLRLSVSLAVAQRQRFWSVPVHHQGRVRPLVAASVGPYGAFLADGSEYTGRYDIDDTGLDAFHRKRWRVLCESEADFIACETIPSQREAAVLLRLLEDTPGRFAWLSFTCRDGMHLRDGSAVVDVTRACDTVPGVAAVGINCTAPEYIASLISEIRKGTSKPVIVYPNSGETYDAASGAWSGHTPAESWGQLTVSWVELGAVGVGGCCRVGPGDITAARRALRL